MDSVVLLWHIRQVEDAEDDVKLIGVYNTEADARDAIARVRDQPGFRDFPDGFLYETHQVGKDNWTEGFRIVNPDGS